MNTDTPLQTSADDAQKVDRRPKSTEHSLIEEDAAKYIGYSRCFLRQGRMEGRGPAYIKVGRAVRYRIPDLDAWLNLHRIEPEAESEWLERPRLLPAASAVSKSNKRGKRKTNAVKKGR